MRRNFFVFLLLFLSLAFAAEARTLLFGIPPYSNPSAIHQHFQPLAQRLTEGSGLPIHIVVAPNYAAHIRNIGTGKVDLAFTGPSPYIKAKDGFGGIEILAAFQMKDQVNDRTVIVVRRDHPGRTLDDIRGGTFAFGDPQSFGSHFMPRHILRRHGIRLADLRFYSYLKNHDNVVLGVLHGDFDAGGIRQDIFLRYQDRPLRILAGPVPTPPHVIVCRQSLSPALKDKLRRLLVGLRDPAVLAAIDPLMLRFRPVVDSDFDPARAIVRAEEQ